MWFIPSLIFCRKVLRQYIKQKQVQSESANIYMSLNKAFRRWIVCTYSNNFTSISGNSWSDTNEVKNRTQKSVENTKMMKRNWQNKKIEKTLKRVFASEWWLSPNTHKQLPGNWSDTPRNRKGNKTVPRNNRRQAANFATMSTKPTNEGTSYGDFALYSYILTGIQIQWSNQFGYVAVEGLR